MDKNTLRGLLMMMAVIFLFMWLQRPSQQEIEARKAEQEQMERQARLDAERAANQANVIDTFSLAEANAIAPTLRQAGIADSTGTIIYRSAGVDLAVSGDAVTGTVNAADTTVNLSTVTSNDFSNLTVSQAKAAVANLRDALDKAARYSGFARYLSGDDEIVTLENELVKLEFSTKGGRLAKATLKDYDTYLNGDTANVVLFSPETSASSFTFTSASQQRFDTDQFYFSPICEGDSSLLMNLDLGKGAQWGLRYTLKPDSYIVSMEVVQKNMQQIIPQSVATIDFNFSQQMARNEEGRTFEERNSALTYKFAGDSPDEIDSHKDDTETLNQHVKWIAFKNQFFSTVFIPRTSFASAEVSQTVIKDNPAFLKDMSARTVLDYSSADEVPVTIDIFVGPNLYPLLASLDDKVQTDEDLDLTRLIPLGWSLFRWINTLIIIPVFTFLSQFISNYGIIILILTIFIKLILFPLTYKSLKSQAKMRLLAPDIKEINEKYPGTENAMKRNQLTMELYSRAGANPMSGCVPMLLQMPILVAMFWFFPSCIELRGESFLWAKNLAAPDVIFTLPFTIPWYGNHVSLFCLLMTAVNIIYTRTNMQTQASTEQMAMMKWMMYLMPVMFLFFFNDYASGLSYYYFLSLLITIVLTYIFRHTVDEEKLRQKMKENSKKPRKKNGWLARLEEAQRKQLAAARAEQQKKKK